MSRSPLLDSTQSVLVVVDMQEALVPHLMQAEACQHVQQKLSAVAHELRIPLLVTEHNPKGLGRTAPSLLATLQGQAEPIAPIEKITFSCMGEERFVQKLKDLRRASLVLMGCETHICVSQTALEAAAAGYDVTVVVDGVTARHVEGHRTGLDALARAGVGLWTWDAVAYQWLRRAGTPEFKACLPHFKA